MSTATVTSTRSVQKPVWKPELCSYAREPGTGGIEFSSLRSRVPAGSRVPGMV